MHWRRWPCPNLEKCGKGKGRERGSGEGGVRPACLRPNIVTIMCNKLCPHVCEYRHLCNAKETFEVTGRKLLKLQ
jgi:hypothetical protein